MMIDKRMFFLAGLPRTGSTLLGSILAQNPAIYVTPTSPMYSLLVNTNEHFNLLHLQHTFDHEAVSRRVYHAMIKAFYADVSEPIIFDKHRSWPKSVEAIKEYFNPEARIICTVRPIAEIITSYLVLADQDKANFIDDHLNKLGQRVTNETRANLLWSFYMKSAYDNTVQGLGSHPQNLLLIQYRDIVERPNETLQRVYDFCGIDNYHHQWTGIENRCAEAKDAAWGLKNLHTIRPDLELTSQNPASYLPREAIDYFSQFDL